MARKKSEQGPATPVTSPGDEARERRYRAQDALRTLASAEEIRRDTALMREVKREMKVMHRAVEKPRKPR